MLDLSKEEQRRHSSVYVPYSYYECAIPDYSPLIPLHWHGEFEISYILSGSGKFKCGEKSVTARQGDIIVILPNILHAIYPGEGRLVYDTIVFSPSMLYGNGSDRCFSEYLYPLSSEDSMVTLPLSADNPHYEEIKTATESIFSCAKGNSGRLDFLLKSELMRMFWLIIESGALHSTQAKETVFAKSIKPALEYIRENYQENISIEQLAEKAHLSKSYFMNKFKSITGISALKYINQVRINAACELLANSDMTSSEAAFSTGFYNISNFNRQFRKNVGCSPKEYRTLFKGKA